jgi:CHAT domain-containing protein/tetratricopeptide (TPR) repeat protein
MRVLVVLLGRVVLFGLLLSAGHAATSLGTDTTKPGAAEVVLMPLEIGATREGALAGDEARTYRFDLPAGVFAQIEVMQRGVDVNLVTRSADGRQQPIVDSPNGKNGPERAYLLGEGKGPLYLEVRNGNSGGPLGKYTLRVEAVRPAGPADRSLVQAERDFAQAESERRESTADSLKRAEASFLELQARFEELGNPRRVAETFDRLGRVRHDLGLAEESKAAYQEAFRRLWALNLQGEAASASDGLGLAYWLLGDSGRAIVCHERALGIYRRLGDRPSEAASLSNLGRDWDLRGDAGRASEAYDQAIGIWRSVGDPRLGIALANRGRLYLIRGELELAEADLLAARPYFENSRELPSLLVDVADARLAGGKEVRPLLNRAFELARHFQDRRSEAVVLNLLGRAAVRRGEAKAAIGFHGRALDLFRELAADREVAATRTLLGQAELPAGECRAALASFSRAQAQFAAVADRAGEAAALLGRARALRCGGDLAEAERDVARVIAKVEGLGADVAGSGLRASWLADWHEAYGLGIDLAMARHAREPSAGHDRRALALSERARARRLIESLSEAKAGICESRLQSDKRLKVASNRVGWLATSGAPDAEKRRSTLEFERLLAKSERDDEQCRRQRLDQALPEWRTVDGFGPAGFERLVEPGTALVEYSLGKERSFAWWVHAGVIESAKLPPRDRIEPIARHLRDLIGAGRPKTSRESISRDLATLAHLLIEPLRRQPGIRRLLIVPDGDLFLVPFAALPEGDHLLVERVEIAVIPSAAALLAIRSRPRAKPESTLGILVGPKTTADWPALPWAWKEAEAIRNLVPRPERIVASGESASRDVFFRWPFQRVRFLHFATHAVFDGEHPSLSGLLLAQRSGRDDILQAYEIQQFRFAADLVVLSACETGRGTGREIRGEGLFGLAQSFLVAGAGSAMASLWQVRDQATEQLMKNFYSGLLQRGLRPSAALRDAELALRRQAAWRDPYYWAGFVIFGEPEGRSSTRSRR